MRFWRAMLSAKRFIAAVGGRRHNRSRLHGLLRTDELGPYLQPVVGFLLNLIGRETATATGQTIGLTISQLVSLGILALAAGLWWYIRRQADGTALPGAAPLTLANRADA